MQRWRAEIHYYKTSDIAHLEFEDWQDFQNWLLAGHDHDWSVVEEIKIAPIPF